MSFDRSTYEFFWLLVRRDLKVRYAGSTLGGFWNLIHPLMMIAIYITIFSSIMRERFAGAPGADPHYGALGYGVHLVAGLLPWMLFSDVLIRSSNALIDNANFLKKVSFPPLVLFLSVLFNALLIQGAGYLFFLGLLAVVGKAAPAAALGGLAIMALFGVAGLGLGLMLAGLNVFFRDTAQILNVVIQLLFWFNPIVYPKERFFTLLPKEDSLAVFQQIGRTLLLLNPFERFISATQWLFGHGVVPTAPGVLDWLLVAGFPVLCLAVGLRFFRRMLPDIRDCI